MQNKLELHKIINYFNELLLLLLFQDYLKSMHTAKTTGNKKEKNNGIMEGTNNRICEVDFEILLRVQKNRGRNHEAEARERERASGNSQTSGEDTA